jgi:hypothetical protein
MVGAPLSQTSDPGEMVRAAPTFAPWAIDGTGVWRPAIYRHVAVRPKAPNPVGLLVEDRRGGLNFVRPGGAP